MARKLFVILPALALASCVGFPLTAKGECAARGHPKGSPTYDACREQLRAEYQQADAQSTQDLLGLFAVGAAVYGASQGAAAHPVTSARVAPLIAQSVNGSQRICTYQTATGQVQSVTPVSMPCPVSLNY